MFKYTLTIAAILVVIPIDIQEVKKKYTPLVIIILYLSIYEHKLLPPQINKPTNGKNSNKRTVPCHKGYDLPHLTKQLEMHIHNI